MTPRVGYDWGLARAILASQANAARQYLFEGRAPAREGTAVTDEAGRAVGTVTSGGFGPSVGGPIAMGYVAAAHAANGTSLSLVVRDVPRPAQVVPMPFFPTRYYRG